MKQPIEEQIPVNHSGNMSDAELQLSLLLTYAVHKLGGLLELPTIKELQEWADGYAVLLTRNTDGTAQLVIKGGNRDA